MGNECKGEGKYQDGSERKTIYFTKQQYEEYKRKLSNVQGNENKASDSKGTVRATGEGPQTIRIETGAEYSPYDPS